MTYIYLAILTAVLSLTVWALVTSKRPTFQATTAMVFMSVSPVMQQVFMDGIIAQHISRHNDNKHADAAKTVVCRFSGPGGGRKGKGGRLAAFELSALSVHSI